MTHYLERRGWLIELFPKLCVAGTYICFCRDAHSNDSSATLVLRVLIASFLKLYSCCRKRFSVLQQRWDGLRWSKTVSPELPNTASKAEQVAFFDRNCRRLRPLCVERENGGTHKKIGELGANTLGIAYLVVRRLSNPYWRFKCEEEELQPRLVKKQGIILPMRQASSRCLYLQTVQGQPRVHHLALSHRLPYFGCALRTAEINLPFSALDLNSGGVCTTYSRIWRCALTGIAAHSRGSWLLLPESNLPLCRMLHGTVRSSFLSSC